MVTPLSKYERNWSVFTAAKKIIVYYVNNSFIDTKILFFGKKEKASVTLIKEGLEIYININF